MSLTVDAKLFSSIFLRKHLFKYDTWKYTGSVIFLFFYQSISVVENCKHLLHKCILEIIVMKKIFRKHRSSRSQVLFKIRVLKNLAKFIGDIYDFLFNKVTDLLVCNFIKEWLQHRCFAMNVAKFSKTSFVIEHPRRLLLKAGTIYRLNKFQFHD